MIWTEQPQPEEELQLGKLLGDVENARHSQSQNLRNHQSTRVMPALKTIPNQQSVLRNSTEEPYAGKPHVGICEGAAR